MASHSEPVHRASAPTAAVDYPAPARSHAAPPLALQRALNDGPRLDQQRRLQRTLAAGPGVAAQMRLAAGMAAPQTRVRVDSAPGSPAPSGQVVQGVLIKVSTARTSPLEPRRVSRVQFADRVPTTVSGGQGDHTVAEALVELTLELFCKGKTHAEIAEGLPTLLGRLDDQAIAKYKLPTGRFETTTLVKIRDEIANYKMAADSGMVEGEDLNAMLEGVLETFLRLWNKRAGAAYDRKSGMTFGGGKEKEGKQKILGVAEQFDDPDFDFGAEENWKGELADAIQNMIDFNVAKGGLAEAANHLTQAIELVMNAIPETEIHYNDIMTFAVDQFASNAGLGRDDKEALDQRVADLMRGSDEDFYALYDQSEDEDSGSADQAVESMQSSQTTTSIPVNSSEMES